VKKVLDDVRSECKEAGNEVVDDPQAGVTIIDLDHDGSKDILVEGWRACSIQIKNFGACNTAGCDLQIFKQIGPHNWKSVFDETIDPVWFLSASQEGYFRLMALSVSRKIPTDAPILREACAIFCLLEARPLGLGPDTLTSVARPAALGALRLSPSAAP
jgi:hypothetical protein